MEAELNSLDQKIAQLVQLCQRLHIGNSELRQQLVTALNENKQLTEKIELARVRVKTLLDRLPEENE